MAMAASAAAVCVAASASSASFVSGASSSWECRSSSRVQQIAQSLVRNRAPPPPAAAAAAAASASAAPCSVKAGCSGSGNSFREVSGINRLSSVGSSGPRGGREWRWQAVAEQLQAADTEETAEEGGFPSDTLSIFFEAEGSLPEASVPKLTSALEAVEGVSNVDISASSDGTATVKLTKEMNVQATGVASGLVDVLLKGGFKLQALNLGFDEEDGDDDDFYEYDTASSTEESEVAE